MNYYLAFFAKFALCLILTNVGFGQTTINLKDPTTRDTIKDLRLFFEPRTLEELSELQHNSDLTISVYSAWLLGQDRINKALSKNFRYMDPMNDASDSFYRQSALIRTEIFGFLSGRIFTELPDWWKDAILSCRNCYNCYCSAQNQRLKSYGFVKTCGLSHRENIKITRFTINEIAGFIEGKGNSEFSVHLDLDLGRTVEVIDDLKRLLPSFDIIAVPEGRFVYVFCDGDVRESYICCCDSSGKILWKSKSGEPFSIGVNEDEDHMLVQLKRIDNKIALFSGSITDVYFDIIDLESGKFLDQFSVTLANSILAYER